MKKLLKHMKILHLVFLILGGVLLISALPFKTQYNMVYINVDSNGIEVADGSMTNARGQNQEDLFKYYEDKGVDFNNKDAEESKYTVYNFEQNLNSTNNMILYFGLVVILCVALLYLFQNSNRKIYYKMNVFISVVATLGVVVFGVIVMLQIFGLMGDLAAHQTLYNTVALLQDTATKADVLAGADVAAMSYVNATTLVAYMLGIIVVMVYGFFLMILTFSKFRRTKERRMEILSKAVENND